MRSEGSLRAQALFSPGMAGYPVFRIPTLISLPGGRVIAFCEGRMDGLSDTGTIHIVARISQDDGHSFGPIVLVASRGEHTVGNPCPLYDAQTGRLHLLYNSNLKSGGEGLILKGQAPRSVLVQHSDDLGHTWSSPRDITASVSRPGWTWYALGPCHGVQLAGGRLLCPANHAVLKPEGGGSGPYISHAVYSDDHGATWQMGCDVAENTNECALAQLADGRIYMNMRSYHGKGCRAEAWSADGGESWDGFRLAPALPDPVCQGTVLLAGEPPALYFCNAADSKERRRLTLKRSMDGAESWQTLLVLHEGPAAYSDLVALGDGALGCLYEGGAQNAYEGIHFCRLNGDILA